MGIKYSSLTFRKLFENVFAIDDIGFDTMYLIEGEEKALLIDTGWGIFDIPELLRRITSKPVMVIVTHGHPDHACGSFWFDEVYVLENEVPLLKNCFDIEYRKMKYENLLIDRINDKSLIESWFNAELKHINVIREGFKFELGNLTLEVITMPGHTDGSIVLLDEKNRMLYTGDSILKGQVWLHLDVSASLSVYLKSLQKIRDLGNKFDRFLPAHGDSPLETFYIDEMIMGVEKIIEGKIKGKPIQTHAGLGLNCEFKNCGIVYNENRLI